MSERAKMRTRWYYTDYVNHMVRFYLTCPDGLKTDGKKRCDVENWVAVQAVLYRMQPEDREKLVQIYKTHYILPKAVETYCNETGEDANRVWAMIAKVSGMIARHRGLI